MPLADPVFPGIPLGDPANTYRVHWNTTGKTMLKQPHTEISLEKLSCNRPTLGCHWRKIWPLRPTLEHHWRDCDSPHTPRHIKLSMQSSIHSGLKWQNDGTQVSKWTGLCIFSLYLEFTALQWIPSLFLTQVSTSTSLCACLWYEHHHSICVFEVAIQMKSVELNKTLTMPIVYIRGRMRGNDLT